ncbi:MAG TPA: glycosyltransferase [bacterium]|jgi:glycosyltransferase involved in cell wall biosynthesis|nr:glycosyltransferase [bacterium]
MDVRVSFVVITRNRVGVIHKAIESWKSLKGPQDELIVVDGDSTDGTYEALRDAQPGLIDLLIHEKDRSEGHAINKGFMAAKGRYLLSLGDDDFYFRDAFEQAYAALDAHPEIDLLMTGGESIDQVGDSGNTRPFFYQWYPDDAKLNETYEFVGMNGSGMVLRRSSLAVVGLFDPRHLHADTSLLTQATVRGACMRYLRVKGYSHRVGRHSGSLTNVRKTYIYEAFGFKGLSRWRYLQRPGEALAWLLRRLGLRKPAPLAEPVWDGKLLA